MNNNTEHVIHVSPFKLVLLIIATFAAARCIKKLFGNKPDLVLNRLGITDYSSGLAVGLILWAEIREFATYQIQRQKPLIC